MVCFYLFLVNHTCRDNREIGTIITGDASIVTITDTLLGSCFIKPILVQLK